MAELPFEFEIIYFSRVFPEKPPLIFPRHPSIDRTLSLLLSPLNCNRGVLRENYAANNVPYTRNPRAPSPFKGENPRIFWIFVLFIPSDMVGQLEKFR